MFRYRNLQRRRSTLINRYDDLRMRRRRTNWWQLNDESERTGAEAIEVHGNAPDDGVPFPNQENGIFVAVNTLIFLDE